MFKVGDKVFDNERGYGEGVVYSCDNTHVIVEFNNTGFVTYFKNGKWVFESPFESSITLFKKEEKMKTYTLEQFKKFATEIEAYENGESIEVKDGDDWVVLKYPAFELGLTYRVKPKLSREEITANWVKENNLKVGDNVKVLKGFEDDVFGINKGWSDEVIGKMAVVEEIKTNRICIDINENQWSFPVECLEKVKEEYIPFSLEDKDLFTGKVVKSKELDEFFMVTYANKKRLALMALIMNT